ncbi:MAG TPA: patatin-like phospholipase family protein [Paenibacillaceae bacterium]
MRVHAVFEGGGVRGIALAGAVRAAEMFGVSFDRVAGTSSGSIVAALIAAGYSAEEMKAIIEATPFASFLHRAPLFNVRVVGPALRLFLFKGLYSGDVLEGWVRDLLAAKGVRTFGDLPPGKLRIIASDITNERLLVLPDDIEKYGADPLKFPVARAIRMSASIPYFFDPVPLRMKEDNGAWGKTAWIVDGGLLSNFPLWLFDRELENERERVPVIGFQMVGRAEAKPHDIRGPVTMLQALVETMLHAHDERYIEKHNQLRTVQIPTLGVGTTEFHISPEKSLELYVSGLKAGIAFFRKWPETAAQVSQIQAAKEREGDQYRTVPPGRTTGTAAESGTAGARPAPSVRFASRGERRLQ